ncbi:MAG: hypothetical protein EOP81_03970 [Variovorax sp.]|nr:MAG: hypothetical protein EOP81_03970 [Variovorax sp.]
MSELPMWAIAALALVVLGAAFLFRRGGTQREARRRIDLARIRSGHLPDDIPTNMATLDSGPGEPIAPSEPGQLVVDEQPRLKLRYVDAEGKKVESALRVEQVDLRRGVMHVQLDGSEKSSRIPLDRVIAARHATSGRAFDIQTWAEAVRVARRRRGEVS